MQIAFVLWATNQVMSGGWMTKEKFAEFAKQNNVFVNSVGFLSFENPGYIVLTQSLSDNISGIVKIAHKSIVAMKIIGEINVE